MEASTVTPDAELRARRIRRYDFRHPDKIGKDQMRELEALYQHVGRLFSSYLSGRARIAVEVSVKNLEQMTYEKYLEGLPSPGIYASVQANPLQGNWLLFMDGVTGFILLDRLFGGRGDSPEEVRSLTEIEQTVANKFLMDLCHSLAEAWRGVVKIEPEIKATASNPIFLQIAGPSDAIVVARMRVSIRGYEGGVEVCMPYASLRNVISRLSPQWAGVDQKTRDFGFMEAILTSLLDAPFEVKVVIGEGRMSLADLYTLRAGDVICLERRAEEPVEVLVEGKPLFLGRPCRVGRTLSVLVTGFPEGNTRVCSGGS
ncbi:MAG TPA: flagellar motor switch protein FliM [Clostridia bacterium]|nr:flagellar motor switch protein FliM [Clostridia bacterium]